MAIREHNGLGGRLRIDLIAPGGDVVGRRQVNNLITARGKNLLAHIFGGQTEGRPELYIAIGGGSGEPAETDVSLERPLNEVQASVTKIEVREEDNSRRAIATVTATFKADERVGEQALSEAGIVIKLPAAVNLGDTSTQEILYNRVVFPVVTRTGNLEMSFTWEVLF